VIPEGFRVGMMKSGSWHTFESDATTCLVDLMRISETLGLDESSAFATAQNCLYPLESGVVVWDLVYT